MLNGEEINPVALSIVELCKASVSQLVENSVK